jgi:2-phospho-L-lactate guanylyltransferase
MMTLTASSLSARTDPDPGEAGVWAVVPVKVLSESKQRLHSFLGPSRKELALAMLKDVLVALSNSQIVEQIVCVTADPDVSALATKYGALVVEEGQLRGMNEAIRLGIDAARHRGGQRVVVLPADLPLATGSEIDRLVLATLANTAPGQPSVIGLGAAANDCGTNFLSLDTAHPFATRFGVDSFKHHQAHARARGFQPLVLASETLSLDIDREQDLRALISFCSNHPEYQSTHTWKFLQQTGLADSPEHRPR